MDPRFDEVYQRGFEGETVVPEPAASRPQPETPPSEPRTPGPVDDEEPRPNRWLVAVWMVSAVLVVASIVSTGWVVSALSDPAIFSGPQFILVLLVPPSLFVPGAVGVLLALAVHTLRTELRPGSTPAQQGQRLR